VTVVASCVQGQRGEMAADKTHGEFGKHVAEMLSGRADGDADSHTSIAEFTQSLRNSMDASPQTPVVYLPDPSPSRLNDKARVAVLEMFDVLSDSRLAAKFDESYAVAVFEAPDQPDAMLARAIGKLKLMRTSEARTLFEEVNQQFPAALPAYYGLAFSDIRVGNASAAALRLSQLVKVVSQDEPDRGEFVRFLLRFSGYVQQYIVAVLDKPAAAQVLHAAASTELNAQDVQLFNDGKRLFSEFARTVAPDKRRRASSYFSFDYRRVTDYLKDRLNR